ncbi:MAG: hypothetical protein WCX74_04045 [Candidatus Paceibacterota bacterium]
MVAGKFLLIILFAIATTGTVACIVLLLTNSILLALLAGWILSLPVFAGTKIFRGFFYVPLSRCDLPQ